MIDKKPKKINDKVFKKYGYVIDWKKPTTKPNENNSFRIIVRQPEITGWRIAYLIVRDKTIDKLEQHVNSMESFEPIKGKAILYVCNQKKPKKIESFILEKPIILKKGIWHGVVSVSKQTHIKITENNKVKMKDVSEHLNISQSNLTERLNSKRSITLDEFFILYQVYGDAFAITVMQHYGSRMLFLEKIKRLIEITNELKSTYEDVRNKNEEVFATLYDIKKGIEEFQNTDEQS